MSIQGTKRLVAVAAVLGGSALLLGGCAVPKFLQEPFEQGVYEDIMERQAEGVPVEEDELKNLPAMTSADYEKLGDTYLGRGQASLAVAKYQKALDLDPRSWRLEYKIGTILLRKGSPGDALPYFQSITQRDPNNAFGWEGQGRALLATGDHEHAENALKKAIRLDASNWKAQQGLGMMYDEIGQYDDAILAYKAALRVRPVEASVLNNLGVAYYLKKDYPQAIDTLEKALRTSRPEDRKRIYSNLGRCYARSGSYSKALDSFRRAKDLPTAYNNVGVVLLEQDRPADAAACFQKAINTSGNFYEAAHENLAAAKGRSGASRDSSICP